jgi:hypothetical protein
MVNQVPEPLEDIYITGKKDREPRRIGYGFEVARRMTGQDDRGEFEWSERWLVIHSERHAKQQQARFLKRLERAEKAVKAAVAKGAESVVEWQARLDKILKEQGVGEFLTAQAQEKIHTEKRYFRTVRPGTAPPIERL